MVTQTPHQRGNYRRADAWRASPVRLGRTSVRFARVVLYTATVAAVLGFFAARSVRAQVGEKTLSIGRELLPFQDVLHGAHLVRLNGEPIFVASAVSTETMGQVLDRFEADCRSHTGGLVEQLDALPEASRATIQKRAPEAWKNRFGVWREQNDKEASIVCIERRDGNGMADAVHGLTTFLATGDVYAIGNLRYIYVRPAGDGHTHVLSTFTEGPFNLYHVIGHGNDEPLGTDPADTPRLPGSTRMMSAELDGNMYGTYVFGSELPAEQALQFYRERLPRSGWQMLVGNSFAGTHVWQRKGVTMVVVAHRKEDEELTLLTFSQGRTTPAGRASP